MPLPGAGSATSAEVADDRAPKNWICPERAVSRSASLGPPYTPCLTAVSTVLRLRRPADPATSNVASQLLRTGSSRCWQTAGPSATGSLAPHTCEPSKSPGQLPTASCTTHPTMGQGSGCTTRATEALARRNGEGLTRLAALAERHTSPSELLRGLAFSVGLVALSHARSEGDALGCRRHAPDPLTAA